MKRKLQCFSIILSYEDYERDYAVWQKLYLKIIGDSIAEDAKRLLGCVISHLMEIYDNDMENIEKIYLPAIRIAFEIRTVNTGVNAQGASTSAVFRPPPHIIQDCIEKLFKHILRKGFFVIVVENSHFMRENSFKILFQLRFGITNSLFVLTAAKADAIILSALNNNNNNSSNTSSSGKRRKSVVHGGTAAGAGAGAGDDEGASFLPWIERKFDLVENFYKIELRDYTVEEIRDLIHANLKDLVDNEDNISIVAHVVNKVTNGSAFWVEDMICFIKKYGLHVLLSATDVTGLDKGIPLEKSSNSSPLPSGEAHVTPDVDPSITRTPMNMIMESSANDAVEFKYRTSFESYLVLRLNQLSKEDQEILRYASVIDLSFETEMLYSILPRRLRNIMFKALIRLTAARFLTGAVNNDEMFSFSHRLLREKIYDMLCSENWKRKIHRRCAIYLENMVKKRGMLELSSLELITELIGHYTKHNSSSKSVNSSNSRIFENCMKASNIVLQYGLDSHLDCERWLKYMEMAVEYAFRRHHITILRGQVSIYEVARATMIMTAAESAGEGNGGDHSSSSSQQSSPRAASRPSSRGRSTAAAVAAGIGVRTGSNSSSLGEPVAGQSSATRWLMRMFNTLKPGGRRVQPENATNGSPDELSIASKGVLGSGQDASNASPSSKELLLNPSSAVGNNSSADGRLAVRLAQLKQKISTQESFLNKEMSSVKSATASGKEGSFIWELASETLNGEGH